MAATRQIDTVKLFHLRKAGGTSLRSYVEALANDKGIEQHVREGHTLDAAYFDAAPTELHITSLREPTARIKSSYLFEGRWEQEDPERSPANAVPFDEWSRSVCDREPRSFLWVSVSNYYVKSLIGYPAIGADGIGRAELDLAKQILERFDIVLISEWMSGRRTHRYLSTVLDFSMRVPHERFPTTVPNPELDLDEIFDEATDRQLVENNLLDTELYQFARDLAGSRMEEPYADHDFDFAKHRTVRGTLSSVRRMVRRRPR